MTQQEMLNNFNRVLSLGNMNQLKLLYLSYQKEPILIPKVHETYALIISQYGEDLEAYESLRQAIAQNITVYNQKGDSGNAYSIGLSNYNAAVISESGNVINDDEICSHLINSLKYFIVAEELYAAKKDIDKSENKEWQLGGYTFLTLCYKGELFTLNSFPLLLDRLSLKLNNFNRFYCAYGLFMMCRYFIGRLLKGMNDNSLVEKLGSSREVSNMITWQKNFLNVYDKDALSKIKEIENSYGRPSEDTISTSFKNLKSIEEVIKHIK
jgi:hypothetical protein